MEAGARPIGPSDGHGVLGEIQPVEHSSEHLNGQARNDDHAMGDDINEVGLFVDQDEDIKSESENNNEGEGEAEAESGPSPSQPHDKDAHDNKAQHHSDSGDKNDNDDESQPTSQNHNNNSYDQEAEHRSDPLDESDGECMVVNENDVPSDTKAKFDTHVFGAFPNAANDVVCLGSVQVKVEEVDDDGLIINSDPEHDDPDFQMDEDDILSDGEGPRKRRRSGVKARDKPKDQSIQTGSPVQLLQKTWKMPDDDKMIELFTQQEELLTLQEKGTLTAPQNLALLRLTARLNHIEKMTTDSTDSGLLKDTAVATENQQDQPAAPSNKKGRGPAPKTAKEYWERAYREQGLGIRNVAENPTKRKRMPTKSNKGGNGKTGDAKEAN